MFCSKMHSVCLHTTRKKQYQNISQKYNFFSSIVERKDLVDQHCIRTTKDTDDGELKLINCGCSDQLKVFLLWNASSKLIAKISGIFDSFQHPILERGGLGSTRFSRNRWVSKGIGRGSSPNQKKLGTIGTWYKPHSSDY